MTAAPKNPIAPFWALRLALVNLGDLQYKLFKSEM